MTKKHFEMDRIIEEVLAPINDFGEVLGIDKVFFEKLYSNEDDWAFLIKTHTLVETALAHLINEDLNRKELVTYIEKLNLVSGRPSKLDLVGAMKLLDKRYELYVKTLSTLRNKASHNIQSISISLVDQVSEMSDKDLIYLLMLPVDKDNKSKLLAFTKINPRLVIWMSAMDLLGMVYSKKQEIIRMRSIKAAPAQNRLASLLSSYSHVTKGLLD